MKLLTKIKNVILRKDPIQLEIEYLEKRGLHLGKKRFSIYAVLF